MTTCFRIAILLTLVMPLWAQRPAFERGTPDSAVPKTVNWPKTDGSFLADDFNIGKKGEIWHIDAVRIWIVSDANLDDPAVFKSVYSKIALFGGIADANFSNGAKAPDCDCHGVIPINADLKVSAVPTRRSSAGKRVYQLDFSNLRWSIPAGAVQIGIQATLQPKAAGPHSWSIVTQPGEAFHLRVFDKEGRLISPYDFQNHAPLRIALRVWAHS
jgi:hypothetical protein